MITIYCYIIFKDTLSFLKSCYNLVPPRHKIPNETFLSELENSLTWRIKWVSLFTRPLSQNYCPSDKKAFQRKKKGLCKALKKWHNGGCWQCLHLSLSIAFAGDISTLTSLPWIVEDSLCLLQCFIYSSDSWHFCPEAL